MNTVTIPKEITKQGDLIAVPRVIYEEFLAWQMVVKSAKTFKPTKAEKKAIERGKREIAKGEFVTLPQLKNELRNSRRK